MWLTDCVNGKSVESSLTAILPALFSVNIASFGGECPSRGAIGGKTDNKCCTVTLKQGEGPSVRLCSQWRPTDNQHWIWIQIHRNPCLIFGIKGRYMRFNDPNMSNHVWPNKNELGLVAEASKPYSSHMAYLQRWTYACNNPDRTALYINIYIIYTPRSKA